MMPASAVRPCSSSSGAVGVPGRLHPSPRFVVGECIVEFDGGPQIGEGVVELSFSVGDFAVEHLGGDRQDVACDAAVSPDLRLRRRRVDLPVIGAQVVIRLDLAQRNAHTRHDNSPEMPWREPRADIRPHPTA